MTRILIVKPSSLNDIVHTLPLAHALKRSLPNAHIGWVVDSAFQPLLAADPTIASLYPMHIPATSAPGAGRGVYGKALHALPLVGKIGIFTANTSIRISAVKNAGIPLDTTPALHKTH